MNLNQYSAESVRTIIEENRIRLFESYAVGRPPNWNVDQRTKDIVCISVWLMEELQRIGVDDLGRITQQGVFNRHSRSDLDIFELAAQVMNDAAVDNIDRYRKTHRRWG